MKQFFGKIFLPALFGLVPAMAMGQTAVDVIKMSGTDLRGTARFMSMGGAFGALGGDFSVLDQNPGGIGVYRSSDVGVTVDFDAQSVKDGSGISVNQLRVNCNNFGYVGAFKLDSEVMPNLNIGFTYTRPVSFNRHYAGRIASQTSSLTDYVASYTNAGKWGSQDLTNANPGKWDPYLDSNAPWMSILSYNSGLIMPDSNDRFHGLSGNDSQIGSEFEVTETGGVDQFNINFGWNISNVVFWGLGFGITNLDYKSTTYYGETVTNGRIKHFVEDEQGRIYDTGRITDGDASYGLVNSLHTFGSGWNFKLGVIVKPVNALRIGLAFHTPTYYSLKDESISYMSAEFTPYSSNAAGCIIEDNTNQGYLDEWWYKIRTPWRFIASAAVVIGKKGIVSLDYERRNYSGAEYDDGSVMSNNSMKQDIKTLYRDVNIFRIGAEYRVLPQLSVRAGYCFEPGASSDVLYNDRAEVSTVSTTPAYYADDCTKYLSCGLGYRYKNFYADLAYVHKKNEGEDHVFTSYTDPMVTPQTVESPASKITATSNRVVATIGVRF